MQDDTEATAEVPRHLGPAYLRRRALHDHEPARQQADPHRHKLFDDLTALFEKHARIREPSSVPHET